MTAFRPTKESTSSYPELKPRRPELFPAVHQELSQNILDLVSSIKIFITPLQECCFNIKQTFCVVLLWNLGSKQQLHLDLLSIDSSFSCILFKYLPHTRIWTYRQGHRGGTRVSAKSTEEAARTSLHQLAGLEVCQIDPGDNISHLVPSVKSNSPGVSNFSTIWSRKPHHALKLSNPLHNSWYKGLLLSSPHFEFPAFQSDNSLG